MQTLTRMLLKELNACQPGRQLFDDVFGGVYAVDVTPENVNEFLVANDYEIYNVLWLFKKLNYFETEAMFAEWNNAGNVLDNEVDKLNAAFADKPRTLEVSNRYDHLYDLIKVTAYIPLCEMISRELTGLLAII